MGFCRETFLAEGRICKTGKQKTAKTSVTAEVWHDTQVGKVTQNLESSHFLSLLGKGEENQQQKVLYKDYFKLLSLDCKYNASVYKSKDTKKILDF